jgi:outer membrane protein assembly factor BamB
MLIAVIILVALVVPAFGLPVDDIVPREFPIPSTTDWRPTGCREVPLEHPALLPRTAFRRAHGDLGSTDEVDLAYPPVFERTWIAEEGLYQVTTPAFDGDGNIYMTPLLPREPILMISLEPETGQRRFVVPLEQGQRGGGAVPVILRDPETNTDVAYMNSYSRVLAVRSDGEILWDVETGLGDATTSRQSPIGMAWVPNADAVAGVTRDGYVFLYDRSSGAPIVEAYRLPGEPNPPRESTIPPAIGAMVDELLEPYVAFTSSGGVIDLIDVLLGGNSVVANNFSVDARTSRLWIASTARDEEDGVVDGVSERGALYRFDVVSDGAGGWILEEICHRTFSGGSASTPTLGRGGERVYLGDDSGTLIAIDAGDCGDAWEVPLESQIFGSVAVASDNGEIYAASAGGIFQVFDDGDHGRRGWTAVLDLYDIPAELTDYAGMNLLLTGIGANGLLIQAGAGLVTAQPLPVRTGIALVDRLTGAPRYFADGLEESLAAMSTGPDGALYLSHSPLRRAFALALGLTDEPLVAGMSRWGASRYDLLMRDAACAAADRGENAVRVINECPDSARADARQMIELIAQTRDYAAPRALSRGELTVAARDHAARILDRADALLASFAAGGRAADLSSATTDLSTACDFLLDPSEVPIAESEDDGCQVSRPDGAGLGGLSLFAAFLVAAARKTRRP